MEQQTKIWKVMGSFDSYKEASNLKLHLGETNPTAQLKIKRGSKCFRVKMWEPEEKKKSNVKKPKRSNLKGKNNKRSEKNDNKKIHARSTR